MTVLNILAMKDKVYETIATVKDDTHVLGNEYISDEG